MKELDIYGEDDKFVDLVISFAENEGDKDILKEVPIVRVILE